uniref:Uncharacterized protein n=1 Tax=Timema genevievae TaxID=629358 RepID=A0A7R9PIS4_TIMGE|nr:unnamed protein product [Timema genevievae]
MSAVSKKSAVNCQSAPKKPWGYCSRQENIIFSGVWWSAAREASLVKTTCDMFSPTWALFDQSYICSALLCMPHTGINASYYMFSIHVCSLILVGPVLVPEAVSVSYSSKLILNDGEKVYPHLYGGSMENHFGKRKNLITFDRDSNLDFPVIGSLVYYDSSILDHRPPKWYQRMSKPEGRRLKELVYLWINAGLIIKKRTTEHSNQKGHRFDSNVQMSEREY